MDQVEIKRLHDDVFPQLRAGEWKPWRESYLVFVERIRASSRDEWMSPDFQKFLWENAGISGVGMGSSVTVATAYADREIAEVLWRARETALPADFVERGRFLVGIYDQVLTLVTPKHNKRRPSAKLVRALAGIFPYDVLCLIDDHKTNKLRQSLDIKKRGETFLQQHVRIRDALRAVTGAPTSIEDAVDESMFAWLVYEKSARTEEEETEGEQAPVEGSTMPAPPTASETTAPSLRVLPRVQQWLGIVHVTDALRLILAIVRDAEHGIARRELIASIQEEAPYLSATSAGKQIALARGPLGLIEQHENELIRPTALGHQILDGESPASVLTPMLIRRVWGFAQALDALRAAPEGMPRVSLMESLRARNGSWTTTMAASAIIEWCKDLELVEIAKAEGQQIVWLSTTGEAWADRVPVDLVPWDGGLVTREEVVAEAAITGVDAPSDAAADLLEPAGFEEVAARFAADPASGRLVLPEHLVGLLHAALHALPRKRFVLLSGLSGTGKTSVAEAYARAYCAAKGVSASTHLRRVPVSPDWSDPAGLLGYVSPLGAEPSFQATQALELLLHASANPTEPFFLVLDEMNLARVEHYFAPFLSAMEGENAMLVIHGTREAVDNVPPTIPWPRNLFILGTVNMDETTHAFSDKVLDRAFSFELWDVDLDGWRKSAVDSGAPTTVVDAIMPPLRKLHEALRGARRHFGYRTCDEILGFCVAAPPSVGLIHALDAAVLAKILPKVRGDDAGPLAGALEKVATACADHELTNSGAKVESMRESLRTLGVVRFSA